MSKLEINNENGATVDVVVITGASAGVGRATAHAFAKRGAKIALMSRNADALARVKNEVEDLGGQAIVFALDVADAQSVEEAASRIEETFGPITVWVNNAMVTVFSPVKDTTAEEYKRVTEVTYLGYVHGTLTALRRMLARDRGAIIQVSSALAYRSIPLQSAYCAAKHAVKGFSESLITELLHDNSNIKVSLINLPAVNTPQFDWSKTRMKQRAQPVPPIYQPEVAAQAILWASQHHPRQLNVAFPVLKALIAEDLAPQLADEELAKIGYQSQLSDEPERERSDNLWRPMDLSYYRTRGRFDKESKSRSLVLMAEQHRKISAVVAAGISTAIVGALLLFATRRSAA